MNQEAIPILIVGAGPTGLTLANLLAGMEVPFLLIDQDEKPSVASKAFGIHARSIEIFDQLGFAEKAVKEGRVDNRVHLLSRDREIASVRIHKLLPGKTKYPYFLILPQNKLEALMISSLEEKGEKVYWQHKLLHYRQEGEHIIARVQEPSGAEKELKVSYLIGCDGANSLVREKGDFSFSGKTFSPTFYLADGTLDWKLPHGDIYFTVAPEYLSIIFSFSEKEKYRVFNFLNTRANKHKESITEEEFQEILNANPYLKTQLKAEWLSVFKVHARITNRFRKGNILLAGDAAHVHSPVGGQGMNTGIQDAYNLAWKLSLVFRGVATSSLLDTYHQERFAIAKALHKTTDRYFQLMIGRNRAADFFRLRIFPRLFQLVVNVGWLRIKLFMRASQLAIHYKFSALSKASSHDEFNSNTPKAGERVPYTSVWYEGEKTTSHALLSYQKFTLLLVVAGNGRHAEAEQAAMQERNSSVPLEVYMLLASENSTMVQEWGIEKEAMFLVRPDGHIAFRSSRIIFDELNNYLEMLLQHTRAGEA